MTAQTKMRLAKDRKKTQEKKRAPMAHGFVHDSTVDYGCSIESRIDGRVGKRNLEARANIRDREFPLLRSDFAEGYMQGTHYDKIRQCSNCGKTTTRAKFHNHAVAEIDRRKNGLNIRCRSCQPTKYVKGYKMDGFIVSDKVFD
jgi:hypothetical protein